MSTTDRPDPEHLPEATLGHVVDGDETLLIRKKRGVGSGQWVGPGGKVEGDETPRECVIREVREEVDLHLLDPHKVGEFVFYSDGWSGLVHVYRATAYEGTPSESDEARPRWFPLEDLPYGEMWPTDRDWLPLALAGEPFRGRFVYADGDPVEVDVDTGVAFDDD